MATTQEAGPDFPRIIQQTNLHQGTSYTFLKQKQKEALSAAGRGDVVCLLPTSYGKTVVIQMLPFLNPGSPTSSIVVVAPLNAILEEQQVRFGDSCIMVDETFIRELSEGPTTDRVTRFKNGKFTFLLGHPEQMIEPVVRAVLIKEPVLSQVSHIVIDEAHVVLSWGKSDFRKAFMDLHVLRTTMQHTSILALTATATPTALGEIKEALHMRHPVHCVKASPDRPSVYLEVKKRPPGMGSSAYHPCVDPVLKELAEKELVFPRTIIYFNLLVWCGDTHDRANGFLRDSQIHMAGQDTNPTEIKSLIAQYHAPQTSKMKSLITASMAQPDSMLRLLLATEAYGMGADCPNIRHIVHVAPPKCLETYVQGIGRCSRDGLPGEATLFYNKSDLGNKHITAKMQEYCTQRVMCRREFLLKYFGFTLGAPNDRCCDICLGVAEQPSQPKLPPANKKVKTILVNYFKGENSQVNNNTMPELQTGLCDSLADQIARYPQQYLDADRLSTDFDFLDGHYVANIVTLIGYCDGKGFI